jgi:hypothetical protein
MGKLTACCGVMGVVCAVNTDADNTIECDISTDKRSAEFNCTKPFKLYDDRETLSLMRMGQVDQESIAKMLPDPGLCKIRHIAYVLCVCVCVCVSGP